MREKREHQRAEWKVPVQVKSKDGTQWETASEDVSVGGMFLNGDSLVPMGTEVELAFELPKLGVVSIPGFVRWVKDGGFGVQFGLMGARETHAIGGLVRRSA